MISIYKREPVWDNNHRSYGLTKIKTIKLQKKLTTDWNSNSFWVKKAKRRLVLFVVFTLKLKMDSSYDKDLKNLAFYQQPIPI
jgi:hypothetical protein